MLNDNDFMRYSRQVMLEDIGLEGQTKNTASQSINYWLRWVRLSSITLSSRCRSG